MSQAARLISGLTLITVPTIVYGGDKRPTHEQEAELHHKAHDGCFVSQSVKTDVKVSGFA